MSVPGRMMVFSALGGRVLGDAAGIVATCQGGECIRHGRRQLEPACRVWRQTLAGRIGCLSAGRSRTRSGRAAGHYRGRWPNRCCTRRRWPRGRRRWLRACRPWGRRAASCVRASWAEGQCACPGRDARHMQRAELAVFDLLLFFCGGFLAQVLAQFAKRVVLAAGKREAAVAGPGGPGARTAPARGIVAAQATPAQVSIRAVGVRAAAPQRRRHRSPHRPGHLLAHGRRRRQERAGRHVRRAQLLRHRGHAQIAKAISQGRCCRPRPAARPPAPPRCPAARHSGAKARHARRLAPPTSRPVSWPPPVPPARPGPAPSPPRGAGVRGAREARSVLKSSIPSATRLLVGACSEFAHIDTKAEKESSVSLPGSVPTSVRRSR